MKALNVLRPATTNWWGLSAPLLLFGAAFSLALLMLPNSGKSLRLLVSSGVPFAALLGVGACVLALRRANARQSWSERTCSAWRWMMAALICFALGLIVHLFLQQAHRVPQGVAS